MKKNVGKIDRTIRVVLGVILLALGFFYQSWLLGILGLLAIITGAISFCGLYALLGISTDKESGPKDPTAQQ